MDKNAVAASASRVGEGSARYDDVSILLHGLTVVLVLVQFVLSQTWGFAPKPTRHVMIVAHMSFGILLTATLLARIGWRMTLGARVRPAWQGPAEWLAVGVHWLLYVLLAVEAVLGFVLRWSGGEDMSLFGLLIPSPFEPWSKPAHHWVGETHEWTGWAIVIVGLGHALAAVYHHVVLKDDVLWRMTPGERAKQMTASSGSR